MLRKKTLGGRLSYNFGFWYCVLITGQVSIKVRKRMGRNEGNSKREYHLFKSGYKHGGIDIQVQIRGVNAGVGTMYSSAARDDVTEYWAI